MKNNLFSLYNKKIKYDMMNKFKYSSIMAAPKINKVTLNIGFGKYISDKKFIEYLFNNLFLISGQKPIFTKCKKSISNFKIRSGYLIGCKVTLRNHRMWNFIERLVYISIPRIRDFRGLSINSFDKKGNYNIGIKEHLIFPELEYDKLDKIFGIDISINIKSNSINESLYLLKNLYFPFINNN